MRTQHPQTRQQVEDLSKLVLRVFSGRYESMRRCFDTDYHLDPAAKPEHWRVRYRRGKPVALVGVYEKVVRIGQARLRAGGIGFVGCEPAQRGHGYATECMEDALRVMRDEGMLLTFLAGIDRYYLRFGYVGCFPRSTIKVRCDALQHLSNPFTVAEYTPQALPDMVRLYDAAAAHTPGTCLRGPDHFRSAFVRWELSDTFGSDKASGIQLFREKRGRRRVRAYTIWNGGALWEAGVTPGDDAACAAVLAWLRAQRVAALEKDVPMTLGAAHPLFAYARRFNHAIESGLSWTGGWMGRIVDVPLFVKSMQPEWSARLATSGCAGPRKLVLLVDGRKTAIVLGAGDTRSGGTLASGAAPASTVTCTHQALLQMSLGTLPWEAIPDVHVEGDPQPVHAVFPESSPWMYRLDHF